MPRDDIDHIPSIVPSRDRDHNPVPPKSRPGPKASRPGGKSGGGAPRPPAQTRSGSGVMAKLFVTVALVVAAVACAWAWQLQQQLKQADHQMQDYESRISDLEDRLSDTDEGMSQNTAVQAAKLKELDTEVRKLWDNVWKKSKAQIAALEKSSKSHSGKIAANEKGLKSANGKLKDAEADLAKLKNVAGDLQRLVSSAKTNQAEVEQVADTLNRINLDMAKVNRQVQSNEEGIRATDAFRRQVNASLTDLEAAIRTLQQ